MLSNLFTIALLLASLTTPASPAHVKGSLVNVPLVKRFNTTGTINVMKSDLARAEALRYRASPTVKAAATVPSAVVTNELVSYIASVRLIF